MKDRSAHPVVIVEIEKTRQLRLIGNALERLHRHGGIWQRPRADDVEIRGVEFEAGCARRAEIFAPPGDGIAVWRHDADTLADAVRLAAQHPEHRRTR